MNINRVPPTPTWFDQLEKRFIAIESKIKATNIAIEAIKNMLRDYADARNRQGACIADVRDMKYRMNIICNFLTAQFPEQTTNNIYDFSGGKDE